MPFIIDNNPDYASIEAERDRKAQEKLAQAQLIMQGATSVAHIVMQKKQLAQSGRALDLQDREFQAHEQERARLLSQHDDLTHDLRMLSGGVDDTQSGEGMAPPPVVGQAPGQQLQPQGSQGPSPNRMFMGDAASAGMPAQNGHANGSANGAVDPNQLRSPQGLAMLAESRVKIQQRMVEDQRAAQQFIRSLPGYAQAGLAVNIPAVTQMVQENPAIAAKMSADLDNALNTKLLAETQLQQMAMRGQQMEADAPLLKQAHNWDDQLYSAWLIDAKRLQFGIQPKAYDTVLAARMKEGNKKPWYAGFLSPEQTQQAAAVQSGNAPRPVAERAGPVARQAQDLVSTGAAKSPEDAASIIRDQQVRRGAEHDTSKADDPGHQGLKLAETELTDARRAREANPKNAQAQERYTAALKNVQAWQAKVAGERKKPGGETAQTAPTAPPQNPKAKKALDAFKTAHGGQDPDPNNPQHVAEMRRLMQGG